MLISGYKILYIDPVEPMKKSHFVRGYTPLLTTPKIIFFADVDGNRRPINMVPGGQISYLED